MNVLAIRGGSRLVGEVDVAGSKNSALSLLSAVVLAQGVTTLRNIPDIVDVRTKARLLEQFGAKLDWHDGALSIDCTNLHAAQVDEEIARSIRTSFFLLGPLLGRLGEIELPAPGGCKIGARPVDFHIKGLSALGAEIVHESARYRAKAQRLIGAEIYLDSASPGATQHIMATAALAEGVTTIHNAAMEPEVVTLAAYLNQIGARVEGAGSATITILGSKELRGVDFRVPSDRIQAGTYMVAAAITQGDITVRGILPETQTPVESKLREAGMDVSVGHDWIRVQSNRRPKATNFVTMPYPGFPTDMQQPMCALLSLADGTSVIEETVYEGRIGHIAELARMGAQIRLSGQVSVITGVSQLRGATVEASDLRAGAALVLAGLAAKGETVIRNVHYIDRGYEKLEETLIRLGADIARVPADDSGNLLRA